MPETDGAGGQGAAGAPEGQGAQGQQQSQQQGQGGEETFDKDRALRTIHAQRDAERQLKAQLSDLQAKVAEHEKAKLTETERLQAKVAELERERTGLQLERQETQVRQTVAAAAEKAGAHAPADLWKLIELSDIAYDDKGAPTNLDDVVAKAKIAHPWAFRSTNGSADGGARRTADAKLNMNDWLRGKASI